LTLRDTTERPITLTEGTNVLVGNDTKAIVEEALKALNGKAKKLKLPPYWDGRTAERIIKILAKEHL
jgi:UDP-N-acetylglucosamine 2-epimerase (non-hydrolysing)